MTCGVGRVQHRLRAGQRTAVRAWPAPGRPAPPRGAPSTATRPRRWSRRRRPGRGRAAAAGRRRRARWSPRPGRRWRGRRCRAAWRCRAAAGGGAPGRPASRRRPRRSPSASPISAAIGSPDHAVVAGPALADVVQQRGDQQQVGPVDVAGQLRGGGGGLDQVPVDGEPVPGVALRQRAHPVPLGQQPGEQPLLVQLLEDGDGRAAAGQQPQEGPAHLRPATARAPAGECTASTLSVYGESSRSARAAAAAARSSRPGSAAGRAPWASTTSSPCRTTPSASGSRRTRRYRPRGRRTSAASTRRQVSSATKASRRPARLTSRSSASSSGSPSAVGHRPLLLADEHVARPAGAPAQLVADVEQEGVGLLHLGARLVGELGGGDGAQHLPLAQAAVGLLEVGLEQEGELADLAGPVRGAGRAAGAAAWTPPAASWRGSPCAAGRRGRRRRRRGGRRAGRGRP